MSTQQKNRTTKAGIAGVALLALVGLGITAGGIGAYWTNSVGDVTANGEGGLQVTAGHLLDLGGEGLEGAWTADFDGIVPGWTMSVDENMDDAARTLTLTNSNRKDVTVDLTASVFGKDKGATDYVASGDDFGDLFAQGFKITIDGDKSFTFGPGVDAQTARVTIPAGGSINLVVDAAFPNLPTNQNAAMDDSVRLALNITQVQP